MVLQACGRPPTSPPHTSRLLLQAHVSYSLCHFWSVIRDLGINFNWNSAFITEIPHPVTAGLDRLAGPSSLLRRLSRCSGDFQGDQCKTGDVSVNYVIP